jgi:hypothetical protein
MMKLGIRRLDATSSHLVKIMEDISGKLKNMNVDENEKKLFRSLFITMFGTFCEKDCFSKLLGTSYQRNKK